MIPKILHQIVGKKSSDLVKECMESWRKLTNYGFEIKYWDDDKLLELIELRYPSVLNTFKSARNHAEAADIGRYIIVYNEGGYYCDWDINLNDKDQFLELVQQTPSGYLLLDPINNVPAAEHFSGTKNEPFLLSVINDIVETFNRGEQDLMFTPQYSGPYRMLNSLLRHKNSLQDLLNVKEVFEYDYIEAKSAIEFQKSGIMTHYWEHSWF
ncbi:hypothetical protein KO02_01450 [Sphingobacterium sp. ML3W]|uniref:glycosyltransferase family 32 protein n=1 Tax=Sphingobacterium sp. ML3W TaxID=1538644 RepID=UPI0004F7C482|nr:glycosyltransferase [Sphingobacterium sp. ML3W]AIM35471.1 hypothetical protein KO02_01450 [Sphingobacterium sp. ML3W]